MIVISIIGEIIIMRWIILESQGDFVAIEVKSGKRGMNSGIPMFQEKFHPLKSIVVGTDGIPFEEFFCMDIMQLFE